MATASPLSGAVIFLSDRPTFNLSAPGLPIEDFEEGIVPPNSGIGFPTPLDSTSNNAAFSPGDILAGIQFAASTPGSDRLALVGDGFMGATTKMVGPNHFADVLDINLLGSGVAAIGFDLAVVITTSDVTVSVFGVGDSFLGGTILGSVGTTPVFLGILSTDPIWRVRASASGDGAELIDNVAFGNGGNAIPEPGTYALVAGGLLGIALLRRRRR